MSSVCPSYTGIMLIYTRINFGNWFSRLPLDMNILWLAETTWSKHFTTRPCREISEKYIMCYSITANCVAWEVYLKEHLLCIGNKPSVLDLQKCQALAAIKDFRWSYGYLALLKIKLFISSNAWESLRKGQCVETAIAHMKHLIGCISGAAGLGLKTMTSLIQIWAFCPSKTPRI